MSAMLGGVKVLLPFFTLYTDSSAEAWGISPVVKARKIKPEITRSVLLLLDMLVS